MFQILKLFKFFQLIDSLKISLESRSLREPPHKR